MRVGAAETEGVDGGDWWQIALARQGFELGRDAQLQVLERDVRVGRLVVEVGGDLGFVEDECGLDQPGDARA